MTFYDLSKWTILTLVGILMTVVIGLVVILLKK